ncbi:MAG: heavy-metal-associated domain-containing protein [Sphingomicrobium sp.]|nr:heavy-metal-associated domain-containing protein [Sphingomonadales bacterium]
MQHPLLNAARAFSWSVAALTLSAAVMPGEAQAAVASVARAQTASFGIANMTCPTCPITVKKAMQGVAGVNSVTINLTTKSAQVVFDPRRTSVAAIAAASANAGFPAKPVG